MIYKLSNAMAVSMKYYWKQISSSVSNGDDKAAYHICCELSYGSWAQIEICTSDWGQRYQLLQLPSSSHEHLSSERDNFPRWYGSEGSLFSERTSTCPALPLEQSSSCFWGISMRVVLALWQSLKCLQCLPWVKSPYSSVLGSWSHPSWWHVQTPKAKLWEWWLQWPLALPLQEF